MDKSLEKLPAEEILDNLGISEAVEAFQEKHIRYEGDPYEVLEVMDLGNGMAYVEVEIRETQGGENEQYSLIVNKAEEGKVKMVVIGQAYDNRWAGSIISSDGKVNYALLKPVGELPVYDWVDSTLEDAVKKDFGQYEYDVGSKKLTLIEIE